ncbi:right-handed parallel beta-helix repeat-containing protein [Belliella sp. R4-6]|uniref:Right-handed parallel beta-helix repeat-containing protein n=1 Tax=Belliella alkalica TaxID=1730871 RepID=A0ABS9VDL8_9BACT|nr:right-handed parallel beta-helix repeat-containing protein [Belliella alkalica]MCH7414529.1 right-handed parallel beta-helix repeat-containing protein [Belliella alkalica]
MSKLMTNYILSMFLLGLIMLGACSSPDEPVVEVEEIEEEAAVPDVPKDTTPPPPPADPFARVGNVYKKDNQWIVKVNEDTIFTGTDMIRAIQEAAGGLFPVRDFKQTVFIHASGETGATSGLKAIDIPSYTILDFQGNTIHVNDTGDDLIVPIRGLSTRDIEIKNLKITGNPRYGIWLQSCRNIRLTNIDVNIPEAQSIGLGIRIDQARGSRSQNVYLDSIYVENTKHHAVETYGVDNITIGTITTKNTGGAGLLLNDTKDGTVKLVNAYRANNGGGYAGFRTANNCGPNIVVEKVIARECGRGVFTVSGSRGITIKEVDIYGSTSHGMLIEDTQDFVVEGGTVVNSGAQGVRITSRASEEHDASSNVTVKNLRVYDDRTPKLQSHGIWETLPRTNKNFILNNDVRNGGHTANLLSAGTGTVVEGNVVED